MKLKELLTEAKVDDPYHGDADERHERANFTLALYHTKHAMQAIKRGDQDKASWHKAMSARHADLDNAYANSPYRK